MKTKAIAVLILLAACAGYAQDLNPGYNHLFKVLEQTRGQLNAQRAMIAIVANQSPVKAAKCQRILDRIDVLLEAINRKAIMAQAVGAVPAANDELAELMTLKDQYLAAVNDMTR